MRVNNCCKLLPILVPVLGLLTQSAFASDFFRSRQDQGLPLQIPVADGTGQLWTMQGHLCRPEGGRAARLVIINHGSPAKSKDRPGMKLASCRSETVQWFLQHHYAVALVTRLGYGATGGPWTEGYGGCGHADFYGAGMETARQIDAMVAYLVRLPGIVPNDVIVVGQSAGGWGTLAYDSMVHPHVTAFINMAGGRGGHYHNQPDSNCRPESLVAAAAHFGKTATTPMLWIYAKNDSFFNPHLALAMFKAFTDAGGKAMYAMAPAFGKDGHHLFFGRHGADVWGKAVNEYIKRSADGVVP